MKNKNELYEQLNSERLEIYNKVIDIFTNEAIEAHVFGSIARGDTDAFSDIDIWFTYRDEDFEKIKSSRMENYKKIGNLLQVIEPPQNAPINGICSSLKYLTENNNIQVVDIYLCPQTTSVINPEAKKLFGIDLPIVETMDYNPQKVEVGSDYRINFFSSFIFGTIKKLARKDDDLLEAVITQYNNLKDKYNFHTEELKSTGKNLITLLDIIEKTKKISNLEQQFVLDKFKYFAKRALSPNMFLLCGLPGSGKTFLAKQEEDLDTIRISHDEEFFARYGKEDTGMKHDEYSDTIKIELLDKITNFLKDNKNVILDYGFWKRKDREEYKEKFKDIANVKVVYFDVLKETRWNRVLNRDKTDNHNLNLEALELFETKFEKPNESEHTIVMA